MAVTKRTNLIIMTADADEVDFSSGHSPYIKYIALETDDVSEAASFDIRDESNANGGVAIIPKYACVGDGSTAPAEFAIEGYVCSNTGKIHAVNIPTGGRVFIYTGRR